MHRHSVHRPHQPHRPPPGCVLLMVDVVDAVALARNATAGFAERWQQLAADAGARVLPALRGCVVRSVGDGLLCAFADARTALRAAFVLQQRALQASVGRPAVHALRLRMAAHVDLVGPDAVDAAGPGVDRALHLLALARPGDLVVTAAVRRQVVDGLHALVEDLGACRLKHIDTPQRCYRLRPMQMPAGADAAGPQLPARCGSAARRTH